MSRAKMGQLQKVTIAEHRTPTNEKELVEQILEILVNIVIQDLAPKTPSSP